MDANFLLYSNSNAFGKTWYALIRFKLSNWMITLPPSYFPIPKLSSIRIDLSQEDPTKFGFIICTLQEKDRDVDGVKGFDT